jgi:hypothetical protein
MPTADITLFLESEDGCEEFRAETWHEAIDHLSDLYDDAVAAVKDDAMSRKVGIIISGEEEEEDEPDEII